MSIRYYSLKTFQKKVQMVEKNIQVEIVFTFFLAIITCFREYSSIHADNMFWSGFEPQTPTYSF